MITANIKRMGMAVVFLLLCFAVNAQTYTVSIPASVDAAAGGTVALPVSVNNSTIITGFEFTLDLPKGCSIESVKAANERTYSTTSVRFDAGTGIVVLTDFDGILAGSGELLTVNINVGSTTAAGKQTISLREIKFVDQSLKKIEIEDVQGVMNVTTVEATSIKLKDTSLKLKVGQTVELEVIFTPADTQDTRINWTSSDTEVATVSNAGKVTAVANGAAIITATTVVGGLTAQCEVSVSEAVSGFEIEKDTINVEKDKEFDLPISMRNQYELRAMSCDIYIPWGIEPVTDARGAIQITQGERANSNVASIISNYNPHARTLSVSVYATGEDDIIGTTGELFSWKLKQDPDYGIGDYYIYVGNIKYTYFNSTGKQVSGVCDEREDVVTVYLKGDANRDNQVDFGDVDLISRHIADPTVYGDYIHKTSADMNDDGEVSIVDATAIISIISNK